MKRNLIIGTLFIVTGLLGANISFAQGYRAGSTNGSSGSGQVSPSQSQPTVNNSQAQQNVGNNSLVGQQGVQDQDRDRDMLRTQDPTTHTGDEPDQTRDQDRLRINDQAYDGTGTVTSISQLRQMIQSQEQNLFRRMTASSTEVSSSTGNIIRNQNMARIATQTLAVANGLMGDSGGKILQIANQINNSLETTTNAELRIQERSRLAKLLWGGDKENSAVIQSEIAQNMARINQANQLLNSSSISEQLREILRAQIQQLEQEQNRLQALAQEELNRWGIFSWRFR
ncbi:MAG: hypothetical protein WCT07_00070 [Candidatus Paceibacterota bacterium]|jgi:hypothetical protein